MVRSVCATFVLTGAMTVLFATLSTLRMADAAVPAKASHGAGMATPATECPGGHQSRQHPAARDAAECNGAQPNLIATLRHRAEHGDVEAMFELANRFDEGAGVRADAAAATAFFTAGAEHGHVPSQHHLGLRLLKAARTEDARLEGLYWLGSAAGEGHGLSALVLGYVFEKGKFGLEVDYCIARQWYEASSMLGLSEGETFRERLTQRNACR